jgi:hypothetical protein
MRNRWLLNLALLLLVAGLAVFVTLRTPDRTASGPALTALSAADIAHLRLEKTGQEPIVLERRDDQWWMRAPVCARANRFHVDGLLRLISAPSELRLTSTPEELTKYGLDRPTARVGLDQEQILVGALHPFKNQHYVLYRGEVHLIASHRLSAVFQSYSGFIDSRLLAEGLQPAAFRLPGFAVTLRDGSWRREPPDETLASDRINNFVAEWLHARALAVERASQRPALDRIQIVHAVDGVPKTVTFEILGYQPEFVLRRKDQGLEYHFPEETGVRLLHLSSEP